MASNQRGNENRNSTNQDLPDVPTVRIFLPLIEDEQGETKVDQTENVIINGIATQIRRGEYVDVKTPVFVQLKQRYPGL